MEMLAALLEAVTTVGFPIACAVVLGIVAWKLIVKTQNDAQKREDKLYSQLDGFKESMDKFNETLIRIDARLEAVEHIIQ